uniref:limulus clotting factor C n=1 Tax=Chilo suppressalis TaxID=168631 RepID=I3UIJ0_CHISP|nr:trypsin-like proteinase [Chilo suppressalis]
MCRYTVSIFTFMYLLCQAICLAAPQTDATTEKSVRIIGGNPTTIEKYPYPVQVNKNNQLICGGTLVSQRCVLSAAHCFVSRDKPTPNVRQYSARVGSPALNTGGNVHQATALVIHDSYNLNTQENDIAVMVLRANVTLSIRVMVGRLPWSNMVVADNASLVHIGWGHTQMGGNLAQVLNKVTVRKVNHQRCASQYEMPDHRVSTNMICAGLLGTGGADACQGDSGGPLIYQYGDMTIEVGVTSWGQECGHQNFPGVSTRVANYTEWINKQIVKYNASPALSTVNILVLLASLVASMVVLK